MTIIKLFLAALFIYLNLKYLQSDRQITISENNINNTIINFENNSNNSISIENNNIKNYSNNNLTYDQKNISIAFAIDNNYLYPFIVLMTSILYNSSPNTSYNFHIMIPFNFLNKNKNKIINLLKKFKKKKSTIKFHNLEHKYSDWSVYGNYTQTVYYRLSLSDIISDLDKIIYLDCDTIVHKDLTEFYNIDMGDYYYMGFPGHDMTYRVFNGTRNFINSGVMLINLKELRKINAPSLFEEYYYNYGTEKVDEYLINALFYNKIKFLPFIYGIPDFEKGHDIIGSPSIFWNSLNGYCNGTEEEVISASKNRVITHGAYKDIKWWSREYDELTEIGKKWIYYASKSNVFKEICNEYKQYQKICKKYKKI